MEKRYWTTCFYIVECQLFFCLCYVNPGTNRDVKIVITLLLTVAAYLQEKPHFRRNPYYSLTSIKIDHFPMNGKHCSVK